MQRTPYSQSVHNDIVRKQVDTYQPQGYSNIKAAHIGHAGGQPNAVNGHIPDVSAQKNGKLVICEVETNDSIYDSSTIEQWRAFDRSGYEFHVSVPESGLQAAKQMAYKNAITVDFFWYTKGY